MTDTQGSPPAVEFQLGISKHENGKHWVTFGVNVAGISGFTVALPPDVADQLADSLPGELKNASTEARKHDNRNPLVIAQTIPEGEHYRAESR